MDEKIDLSTRGIADRLREVRRMKKITQSGLAADVEDMFGVAVSRASISAYENGTKAISALTLGRLALAMDADLQYIMYGIKRSGFKEWI
ncbi:MAG: helix-turn-helix domain-containing protein [Oscillospiraceae bacterium]|nr:helix-turn-helix domain-containing protein [Oscillospiraceae bacterium]